MSEPAEKETPELWCAHEAGRPCDCEQLVCESREEAIEECLDVLIGTVKRIDVRGWSHDRLTIEEVRRQFHPLELILDALDEEYGSDDGDYDGPSERMEAAELDLLNAVVADYRVWRCHESSCETIDVEEYRRADAEELEG